MLKIRQAISSNQREICQELDREIFPDDYRWNPKRGVWWLAESGIVDVAYAGACLVEDEPETLFLGRCGVLPDWRGRGLQRKLIRVREAWGRRNGATHAITYVVTENIKSANNLIKCGYSLYVPAWKWAGSKGVLYFWKKL